MKRFAALIGVILLGLMGPVVPSASARPVNLPPGVLIVDSDGIRVSRSGVYFIDASSIQAGDIITKRLTIRNNETNTVRLAMRSETLEETGPLKLLDEIHMTLTLDGRIIYGGRLRGNGGVDMTTNALDLGTFEGGKESALDIVLKVPADLPQKYTVSEALHRWVFTAKQDPEQPKRPGGSPKMGDIVRWVGYVLIFGVATVSVGLLIAKRRNVGKEQEQIGLR